MSANDTARSGRTGSLSAAWGPPSGPTAMPSPPGRRRGLADGAQLSGRSSTRAPSSST
jgi:hypothetical protein